MKNAFAISWRYQQGRKSHLVSLISWFSMIGIALGVAVLIIGLSAMNGFEKELNQRILSVVPQVEITSYAFGPESQPIENYPQLQSVLQRNKSIVASAPYVSFQGLLENGTHLKVAQVRGIDPQSQEQVSRLRYFVLDNGWQTFKTEGGVILGAGIAQALHVKAGDWISLLLAQKNTTQQLSQPQEIRLKVAGILQLHGQLDYVYALMRLDEAQALLGYTKTQATGVELKVQQPFLANQIRYPQLQTYPQGLQAQTWMAQFGYMYHDIRLIRMVMYLAMALVIAVACFNIVSTLIMAVKDKQGDIAVLRTLGANSRFIRRIFIYYGLIAGLKGCVAGIILGVLVSLNLTNLIKGLEHLIHHKFLSGGIYFIDFMPSELHWQDVGLVFICALVLSLVASLYPARRAAQIPPAKVLMNKG